MSNVWMARQFPIFPWDWTTPDDCQSNYQPQMIIKKKKKVGSYFLNKLKYFKPTLNNKWKQIYSPYFPNSWYSFFLPQSGMNVSCQWHKPHYCFRTRRILIKTEYAVNDSHDSETRMFAKMTCHAQYNLRTADFEPTQMLFCVFNYSFMCCNCGKVYTRMKKVY